MDWTKNYTCEPPVLPCDGRPLAVTTTRYSTKVYGNKTGRRRAGWSLQEYNKCLRCSTEVMLKLGQNAPSPKRETSPWSVFMFPITCPVPAAVSLLLYPQNLPGTYQIKHQFIFRFFEVVRPFFFIRFSKTRFQAARGPEP